jgi:hypothetical protein
MLTRLQERVARLLLALPEAERFALAGGAALILQEGVDRSTEDLDFFAPGAEGVRLASDDPTYELHAFFRRFRADLLERALRPPPAT